MNNNIIPQEFVSKNKQWLDIKKPQTTYKIKYVTKYVEKWLFVVTNVDKNKNINFIDCMCNAGIYTDGGKGTSIQVLELFIRFAEAHPDKTFNLILNDISKERLEITKEIITKYIKSDVNNVNVIFCNKDVNEFLKDSYFFNRYFNCYPYTSSNLVFVDPYNFCTVKISVLEQFLSKNYCELIFNVFTSDFVRNQDKEKMRTFCAEEKIKCTAKDEMIDLIKTRLKVGYIKYSFAYEFKIKTNAELYQIMFFTPNLKGLEKLKEALWDTFNGKEFHRNRSESSTEQISLFTQEDEKDWMTKLHSATAKELVLEHFANTNDVSYMEIETFIIGNTILNANQILNNVLKPLIKEGKIKKLGKVKMSSNYKEDKYNILGAS